jgi:hypothetical protein
MNDELPPALKSKSSLGLALAAVVALSPQIISTQELVAKDSSDLRIIHSAVLDPNLNVPWSEPVRIQDPFEGEFLAIFDKNYFFQYFLNTYTKIDVISLWRKDSIRVLLAYSDRDCLSSSWHGIYGGFPCTRLNGTEPVTKLYIKLGERVFELEGENNIFQVSDELASALRESPPENVNIRLFLLSGATIDSQIGRGTVEAWKAIY